MKKGIRITVEDLETGDREEKVIRDDWCVITDGQYRVHHIQRYGNGTVVLVLKRGKESTYRAREMPRGSG